MPLCPGMNLLQSFTPRSRLIAAITNPPRKHQQCGHCAGLNRAERGNPPHSSGSPSLLLARSANFHLPSRAVKFLEKNGRIVVSILSGILLV